MSLPRCAALILSAGLSSRVGSFKPLLQLGSQTLVERAVALFRAAGVEDVRVVVGHRAHEVMPLIEAAGAQVVPNARYPEGMFSSVRAGVETLGPDVDAFYVLPVDVPLVRPWTVRRLREVLFERGAPVVYPRFAGARGHPPLIAARCRSAIRASDGLGGLRAVLRQWEAEAADADVADRNILFDVDGPEEWEEAVARWRRRSVPTREECEALLRHVFPVDPAVLRHSQAVARVALAVDKALAAAGVALDLAVVEAAALLHDIAKGQPEHARAGARILEELGYPETAAAAASHVDFEGDTNGPVGPREVVYLADQLAWGDRVVPLEARFSARMAELAGDPAARAAAESRLACTRRVRDCVAAALGQPLEYALPELRRFPRSPIGCWRDELADGA